MSVETEQADDPMRSIIVCFLSDSVERASSKSGRDGNPRTTGGVQP
jgi:hypothetical protein